MTASWSPCRRAVAWAALAAGMAATIIQPQLGDAAAAVRKVAVGVSLVSILGAAAGVAWFAADATTAAIVPAAPAAAAALTVAALFLPVRDRLERTGRPLAVRRGRQRRPADRLVRCRRRARRPRRGARTAGRHVAAGAAAALGEGVDGRSDARSSPRPASSRRPNLAAAARVALIDNDEQLGLLECGPKRGGPLNAHDRQLLGALGREAALRLRTVSQADELEARLRQIERQAVEVAASRARIVEAQDAERRRIERDIHDGVQQELASLIGKLRVALNQIGPAPEDASATIAGAQDDVRRALADVRAIAQGIHPAILDDHGIVRAIDARAKRLPLEVTVDAEPDLDGRRFDRAIEGAAYFVASEAMANIVKHAEATAVEVRLAIDGDRLVVQIGDDGRGLGDDLVRGSGLTNMADRAAALGGTVAVEASPSGRHHGRRRAAAHPYCCRVSGARGTIDAVSCAWSSRRTTRCTARASARSSSTAASSRSSPRSTARTSCCRQVDELVPDAVITDIRMPPTHHMEGIEAAHEIRRRHPGIGILVLSQHADDSYAFELLKDGTAGLGYLLKERIGDDDGAIARALKEVVAGRSVIDPEVVDGLVSRQAKARSSPLHRLTDREREVMALIAQGKTNEAIADSLHLHRATVEKHINAIFLAFDLAEEKQVNKRVAAVLLFLRDA